MKLQRHLTKQSDITRLISRAWNFAPIYDAMEATRAYSLRLDPAVLWKAVDTGMNDRNTKGRWFDGDYSCLRSTVIIEPVSSKPFEIKMRSRALRLLQIVPKETIKAIDTPKRQVTNEVP